MTDTTKPTAKPLPKKIQAKLDTLNALRTANGKVPLVTWKNAEALLDQRIAEETPTYSTAAKPRSQVATDFLSAVRDVLNGADPDMIADAVKAGKVTVLPAAPEVRTNARRKAVIQQIANTHVAADTPVTVIDAKAASRALRKADKKSKAPKTTTKKTTTAAKVTTPKATNEFGALLKKLGLDAKKARAKLRANGMSAPYTNLKEIEKVLTTDGRKKAK